MYRILIGTLAATCAAASPAHGACTAQSGADRPHLVELYTSEGCSSCPPAEKWMSKLVGKPDEVGLEFHVDYWDEGGWRDPFDSKAYTKRQEKLSRKFNKGQFYTPQVWIDNQVMERDGALWFSWDVVEGLFPDGLVEEMFAAFAGLLGRLADDPGCWDERAPVGLGRLTTSR